jgi:formate dehydrogenase assembly factor FdhD
MTENKESVAPTALRSPLEEYSNIAGYGAAGDCAYILQWHDNDIEYIRTQVQGRAATVKNFLSENKSSPQLVNNTVAVHGLCGLGTITILFAPSEEKVQDALGQDLEVHRSDVQSMLELYKDTYTENNCPHGTARSDPGGCLIVCDPDISRLFVEFHQANPSTNTVIRPTTATATA